MSGNKIFDEFPGPQGEEILAEDGSEPGSTDEGKTKENRLLIAWERLSRAGMGETVFRLGTDILSIALVLVVIWAMRTFYLRAWVQNPVAPHQSVLAAALPSSAPTEAPPELPVYDPVTSTVRIGIPRLVSVHTDLPTQPRIDVITYTVESGDTIFGIAEKFNLKPQTILWGNYYTLADNPDRLQPGQVLNILPVNGIYHRWSAGEGLNGVSKYYGVKPETIVNWPGNHLDPKTIGDYSHPNITPGTMLIVPGGKREFISWSAPMIPRSNPGVAKILGPGFCGVITTGAVGHQTFVWPARNHYLSGYNYSPETNHLGIDIAGHLGDPIFAADSGVVVYSGWNNWDYGNVVVIDHGDGWQTLYAHMSVIGVSCGQSVDQGGVIGQFGSTGNSSGPHLHFEMLSEKYGKVNPWNFLPPP